MLQKARSEPRGLRLQNKSFRKTALITGASSGIGRQLALQCAAGGMNLVVVARNREALDSLSSDCQVRYGSKVIVICADLSQLNAVHQIRKVLEEQGTKVDVLINNAGFGIHGAFVNTDVQQECAMHTLQINALVALTKAVLPHMIARGSGRILNVASVYAWLPVPYQAVYGASKAFMKSFSQAIAFELRGSGVKVTLLCPGSTQTNFRKRAGISTTAESTFGMSAETVARIGYKAMLQGRTVAIPGIINRTFIAIVQLTPERLLTGFIQRINSIRGLRKGETSGKSES